MANDDLTRPVGVWRALGEFKLKDAMWPEGLFALVIGGGGSALVIGVTKLAERVGVIGDVLVLAGAFLAVVFTALAIVVSLPSTSYLRMLGETPEGGMRRFLDPFLVAVGTQLAVVFLAVAYRLVAGDVASWVEHVGFGLVGFLFVFGLLDIAALARQLVRHGILRAADAALEPNERERDHGVGGGGTVRPLPGRRGENG
jgi:hypothetical protein